MSTDRDTTRVVRSWLDEGVNRLPDRVLDAVLDQIPATPQRRHFWSAWRPSEMNLYAKLIAGAAAAVVIAFLGYQLLPSWGLGPGAPSPSPTLLARGTFKVVGTYDTTIDATGAGSNVSGTMTATSTEGAFTVDLQCERTIDGLRWIGGDVTQSTLLDNGPVGSRTAILLKPGSPVQAIFVFQMSDPQSASCQAFFDDMVGLGEDINAGLEPIVGTLELAP